MTEIYLIRHAQAEGNIYRMMQGHWNGKITNTGKTQISLLAERFKNVHIDEVWSSDLSRTVETAQAITKYHPLNINKEKGLREINLGRWETCFFGNLIYEEGESVEGFLHDSEHWRLDGAETYPEVRSRMLQTVRQIAEQSEGKTIAVVSHGVAIRSFLSGVTGISLNNTEKLPIAGNTAVNHLLYNQGKFTLLSMNDTSHLDVLPNHVWGRAPNLRSCIFDPRTDWNLYTDCYKKTWLTSRGSLKGFTAEPYYSESIVHYLDSEKNVQLVKADDKLVGMIEMDSRRGIKEGYLWIVLLYITEDMRRIGCGTQLLGRAVEQCRKEGFESIRLRVDASNIPAIQFYKKNGFELLRQEGSNENTSYIMEMKAEE